MQATAIENILIVHCIIRRELSIARAHLSFYRIRPTADGSPHLV